MAYIGSTPVPQGIKETQSFTATAGQQTFNTFGYSDGNNISVFLNGVRLINGTDYTATNGSDIVLTAAASASDVLDFETFNEVSLVNQEFTNSISVEGDGTSDTAVVTVQNSTKENTDGGRESRLRFRGFRSGDVGAHTLAEIQGSHDGTGSDQKGDLIFKTNDGTDNAAPTERARLDSLGRLGLGTNSPADNLEIDVAASNTGLLLTDNGDGFFPHIKYDSNRSSAGQGLGKFSYNWNGTEVARIEGAAGTDATNKDDGGMIFYSRTSGSSLAARWEITTDGHFKARANGLGIDFSAVETSTSGVTVSSSILDDYEEGTYDVTATLSGGGTVTFASGGNAAYYTKIGNLVTTGARLDVGSVSSPSGHLYISLPFTPDFSVDSAGLNIAAAVIYNPSSDLSGHLVAEVTNSHGGTIIIRQNGGIASGVTTLGNLIDSGSLVSFTISYRAA